MPRINHSQNSHPFAVWHRVSGQFTIEILIAVTILTAVLTSAMTLIFSGQSLSTDSAESNQAIRLAEQNLEDVKAKARYDFNSLASSSVTQGEFTRDVVVSNTTTTGIKQVVSRVSWKTDPLRTQSVEFTTFVTDWTNTQASGGDTGGGGLSGDWANPRSLGSVDLGAGVSATDLDAVNKKVYLTGTASASSKHDFFVVDATDGQNPQIVSSLNTTNQGLQAIDVAGNYAYVANNNNADDKQLQIIDISSSTNPSLVSSYTLPGATEDAISIFYSNSKAYVGVEKNSGAEFFVVDVSNPSSPVSLGSKEINEDVTDISVSGNTAYLTTPNDKEIKILNVSDPSNIALVSEYNIVGTCEDGESLYLVGTLLYAGRTDDCGHTNHHKFSIVNVGNSANPGVIGSTNVGSDVNGIVVRDKLAFLATSDTNKEFQVFDISNASSITSISSFNFPNIASGIDYEDNIVYVSVRSNDGLRIITSQ